MLFIFLAGVYKFSEPHPQSPWMAQGQSALTDTYISNLKVDLHLKMQRITLQRLVIDGDFAKVEGCKAVVGKNPRGFLGIRWPVRRSLDEICKK